MNRDIEKIEQKLQADGGAQKLVVVGYSFGLTKGINEACVDSYKNGIVTDLCLMLRTFETEDAIGLIDTEGIRHVGLHLSLNEQKPYMRVSDYVELFNSKTEAQISDMVREGI